MKCLLVVALLCGLALAADVRRFKHTQSRRVAVKIPQHVALSAEPNDIADKALQQAADAVRDSNLDPAELANEEIDEVKIAGTLSGLSNIKRRGEAALVEIADGTFLVFAFTVEDIKASVDITAVFDDSVHGTGEADLRVDTAEVAAKKNGDADTFDIDRYHVERLHDIEARIKDLGNLEPLRRDIEEICIELFVNTVHISVDGLIRLEIEDALQGQAPPTFPPPQA